jgi:arginine-tRNA-protein transferase
LQAQAANLPFVYLGYWIKNSPKMAYKTQFQPLELLRGGTWRPYKPAEECEKIDNALSGPDAGEGP